MNREATFQNEFGEPVACRVIRLSSANTRIELEDGTRLLVPSAAVQIAKAADAPLKTASTRMIPRTPLEYFYRQLRRLKGSPPSRFHQLIDLLDGRGGPVKADFLSELFARSVRHASFYNNTEPFYPDVSSRTSRKRSRETFAPQLVRRLCENTGGVDIGHLKVRFVDYEVYPFRTTQGCDELGRPATSAGSGGLDLLLASEWESVQLPAVGEIKAQSEQVGATFAIIQSLMYASQLTTPNQLERLRRVYGKADLFHNVPQPRCDIFIILESGPPKNSIDDAYAAELAAELLRTKVSTYVRSITIATYDSRHLRFETMCSLFAPH